MNDKGYVLLEWLVASALVIALAGAVFSATIPVRDLLDRTQLRVELAVAARNALDLISAEVREAGGSFLLGPPELELSTLLAPVVLGPSATVVVRRVPHGAAQAVLAADSAVGAQTLALETATRCWSGPPVCGFRPGDTIVLVTTGVAEIHRLTHTLNGAITISAAANHAFPAGTVVARFITTSYETRLSGGEQRLVRVSDGGAEQPIVDSIVRFDAVPDTPNPHHARRLSLRLRVQAPAHLRGPEGYLFARAGSASGPSRWLADIEVRTDVAIRNGSRVW